MQGCDICGNAGIHPIVSSDQMRNAVFINGFNPFALGLISAAVVSEYEHLPPEAARLFGKTPYEVWKNTLVTNDTKGWGVCSLCKAKLQPYLNIKQEAFKMSMKELELKCNKCGSKYLIGKDAGITTTNDVLQTSLGFRNTFVMGRVPSAPSYRTDPALVSYQTNTEAKEKSLQTAESIQQFIRQGVPQFWWCEKCKNTATPHEFPAEW